MDNLNMEYKYIEVEDKIVQIKFDTEGVVYDIFDSDEEHIETCGFDLYEDIPHIKDLIIENQFLKWIAEGNAYNVDEDTYKTQQTLHRGEFTYEELKSFFIKEFINC